MQDFSFITTWIDNSLRSLMPGWLAVTTECLLVGVGLLLVYALLALFYIYYERKLCAAFQCRLGPNRVGPMGFARASPICSRCSLKRLFISTISTASFSPSRLTW